MVTQSQITLEDHVWGTYTEYVGNRSVWHMAQTQSGVWIEEIDLQKKSSVRPSVLMGSCDVYDPPLSESTLNLPQGTMSGALTRNMLENRLCVTQDTDTSGDMGT